MVEGNKKIQKIKKRERMKGEGKKQETEKEKQD